MPMAWHEKLKRGWGNVMLAHEAMVLNQVQNQAELVNRLVRKAQDGTLGQATSEPDDPGAGDMGIRIGDENHYHLPVAEAAGGLSGLVKAGLILAGLLGAGGVGLGGGWLVGRTQPPAPTAAPGEPDRLHYDLRLTPIER